MTHSIYNILRTPRRLIYVLCLWGSMNLSAADYYDHGTCGDNLQWFLYHDTISDTHHDTLRITGAGLMMDYDNSSVYAPWHAHASHIDSVYIEDGVTNIGDYAFAWSEQLKALSLPNTVTMIGDHAFYNCDALSSLTLPANLDTIGDYAFVWCHRLPTIDLPVTLNYIGQGAFTGCYSIPYISIPDGVTNIQLSAFSWCSNMTYLRIGDNVTNIGAYAFAWCERLESIINYTSIPQDIEENVFAGLNRSTCTLYVPSASIDLYRSALVWRDFNIADLSDAPTLVPKAAEGFDILSTEQTPRKVLYNGQIFIIRGGKRYTLQGKLLQ